MPSLQKAVCENLSSTQGTLMSLHDELWVQLHLGNREMGAEIVHRCFSLGKSSAYEVSIDRDFEHRHPYRATPAKSGIP